MRYHNITTDDMRNGDGLRVVLWLAGCDHHCKGCHNKITWDPSDGIDVNYKTENELLEKLEPDYISGLTLSGGDPLFYRSRSDLLYLLQRLKTIMAPEKNIWMYTGYTWEELMEDTDPDILEILEYIDVLVDGRFVEELKDNNYPWAGSTNQRVINVQESLKRGEIVYHVDYKERFNLRRFRQAEDCKCCE